MLSFDDMKMISSKNGTIGQQLKSMSDMVMQETFDRDIQTRLCYIYDYYHDDQPEKQFGYDPSLSKTKIPVKLKFIVKSYKTFAKDEPDYHIQFEPDVWNSMSCVPDWYEKNYGNLEIRFPMGLFVDIPDDRGVYHKWLTVYYEDANQFPKIGVLECNYRFMWIEDDGLYRHKRKMWGVNSTQNSYTSGVWRDYRFQGYDDQDKFYLPWNPITSNLEHDKRLAISMLRKNPWTYIVTKIDDTATKGLLVVTVKQDKFEPEHDYVQLDPNASDYGDMFSDYYSSTVLPEEKEESIEQNLYKLKVEAPNYFIRLGNAKILTAKIYDAQENDVTSIFETSDCKWNFNFDSNTSEMNDLIDVDSNYSTKDGNKFKVKFVFTGDEQYINNTISVECKIGNLIDKVSLDIAAL